MCSHNTIHAAGKEAHYTVQQPIFNSGLPCGVSSLRWYAPMVSPADTFFTLRKEGALHLLGPRRLMTNPEPMVTPRPRPALVCCMIASACSGPGEPPGAQLGFMQACT